MASSIRRLTTLDHQRLYRLLRRMCTPGPNQPRWREEFVGLLAAHRAAERDCVVPEIVTHLEPLSAAARELTEDDVPLDRLAAQVERLDLHDADLAALQEPAETLLAGHALRWGERLMYPLEALVARGELRRLGGAYEKHRDEALAGAGVTQSPPRRLDLSRAELYELARRAGIEGRSAMTRGQLIDQLRDHDH